MRYDLTASSQAHACLRNSHLRVMWRFAKRSIYGRRTMCFEARIIHIRRRRSRCYCRCLQKALAFEAAEYQKENSPTVKFLMLLSSCFIGQRDWLRRRSAKKSPRTRGKVTFGFIDLCQFPSTILEVIESNPHISHVHLFSHSPTPALPS